MILGDSVEIRFKFQRSVGRIYCATDDDALLLTTGRPDLSASRQRARVSADQRSIVAYRAMHSSRAQSAVGRFH